MDLDGNAIPDIQILGYGRSELEVLHDGMAVKMPFRCKSSTDDDEKVNIKVIQREQDVYRRLGCCDGVVMVSSHQYLQYDYSTCIHGKWRPHILYGFQNADRLSEALDFITWTISLLWEMRDIVVASQGRRSMQAITKLAVTAGALTILTTWIWRWF
ncbi:hypothetical protein GX50_00557 [[Emmonsia] crescens]|uniref:Uncharacterized protein n=1 Tax=[Emmonsia] crescens TaxID=73230 RepID=A0A2B7ZT04_9EURO|nr:hypothetical protein GX50_00557 [Emmonsia crescens]